MSRTFFPLRARKGSKATHEGHLLHTWQYPWNVSELCARFRRQQRCPPGPFLLNPSGSGEKLHLASFPLRPEDLQDTGGSNALQDSTCVYMHCMYMCVCLIRQNIFRYEWICRCSCVCVCFSRYVYVTCMCVNMYMHVCVACTCICVLLDMGACQHVCIFVNMCVSSGIYKYIYTNVYICMEEICVHMCTVTCVFTYTSIMLKHICVSA